MTLRGTDNRGMRRALAGLVMAAGLCLTPAAVAQVEGDLNPDDLIEFSATSEPIELIVDLREPTEIHAVAINLLVRPDGSAGVPQRIVITFSDDGREYRNPNSRHNAISPLTTQSSL